MFKPSKNPKIEELTKTFKKRAYLLGNLSSIKLDGVHRNCIWCLERLDGKKLKWCSEECVNSALAWARPQCEQGLHVLLAKQDFKCGLCTYDYMPYALQAAREVGLTSSEIKTQISFYLMRTFRGLLPKEIRAEVDHIISIGNGGTSIGLDNHMVLCAKCHKEKTSKDLKKMYKSKGHPLKGRKITAAHSKAMSESRIGFDSDLRIKGREENLYPKLRVAIIATHSESKEEVRFESITEAARVLNLQESNISRVLTGDQNRKQHKGWTFRYD